MYHNNITKAIIGQLTDFIKTGKGIKHGHFLIVMDEIVMKVEKKRGYKMRKK